MDPGAVRYFDLMVSGPGGWRRVHGWYEPTTRRLVQLG